MALKERAIEYFEEKCLSCKDYNGLDKEPICNRVGNTCGIDLQEIKRKMAERRRKSSLSF